MRVWIYTIYNLWKISILINVCKIWKISILKENLFYESKDFDFEKNIQNNDGDFDFEELCFIRFERFRFWGIMFDKIWKISILRENLLYDSKDFDFEKNLLINLWKNIFLNCKDYDYIGLRKN